MTKYPETIYGNRQSVMTSVKNGLVTSIFIFDHHTDQSSVHILWKWGFVLYFASLSDLYICLMMNKGTVFMPHDLKTPSPSTLLISQSVMRPANKG
jgi:hypothetical protein